MPRTIRGNVFDYPKYYDLVFGSDWKAEYAFLTACFEKHASRPIKRLFEPACGTGRLLIKFAESGYAVAGNDLCEKAVEFCNKRLRRRGFKATAVVGDMSDFKVARPFDAAFNMINSFRHLLSQSSAESHLKCVARGLNKGGLYVLGMHLTPTRGQRVDFESWSARRGSLVVNSTMWTESLDLKKRVEHLGMTFDVFTPTEQFQILDKTDYRTYTAPQLRKLLTAAPQLELAAVYDFAYEIDDEIEIGPETEDVVLVLRKK